MCLNILSTLLSAKKVPIEILIVGNSNVGKKTLLSHLNVDKAVTSRQIPTVGVIQESVEYGNVKFTTTRLPPPSTWASLMRHFYSQSAAVIWVMSTADEHALRDCQSHLSDMINSLPTRSSATALVVLCNKDTRGNVIDSTAMADEVSLGINTCKELPVIHAEPAVWKFFEGNIKTGQGIQEVLDWLQRSLQDQGCKVIMPDLQVYCSVAYDVSKEG